MKKTIFLALLATLMPAAETFADGFAYIQGIADAVERPRKITLIRAEHGLPQTYATTRVMPSGSFGFAIEPAADAPYYYLSDGKQYFRLCLQAGNTVKVTLKNGEFAFSEPANETNRILQRWLQVKQQQHRTDKQASFEAFFERFEAVEKASQTFLASIRQENPARFEQLTDFVRLDLLNDFITYIGKHQQTYDGVETQSTYFKKVMSTFPETSAALLDQPYGCALMKAYFDYKQTYIYRQTPFSTEQQLAEIHNNDLRTAYLLADMPTADFGKYREYENRYLPLLPDEQTRNRMRNNPLRPIGGLQRGDKAPNLIFQDAQGRLHSMAELRGKWVYIDVWATWCVPCKAEIPALKAMEKQFAGNKVAFVSISIDKNRQAWEQFVSANKLGGLQLWAGDWTAFPREMGLGSVPRFLLIDPQGNWFDANAPRPSSGKIQQILMQQSGAGKP